MVICCVGSNHINCDFLHHSSSISHTTEDYQAAAHALWLSAQDAHVLLGLDYITEMNLSMLGKISKQKN